MKPIHKLVIAAIVLALLGFGIMMMMKKGQASAPVFVPTTLPSMMPSQMPSRLPQIVSQMPTQRPTMMPSQRTSMMPMMSSTPGEVMGYSDDEDDDFGSLA